MRLTRRRLDAFDTDPQTYNILTADSEDLPFESKSFNLVYTWGVLHHTSDTPKALSEAYRVLKPGGTLKMMVYAIPSWVGLLLQIRHGLLNGNPLYSQKEAMWNHLESPGTEGFTNEKMANMLDNLRFDGTSI